MNIFPESHQFTTSNATIPQMSFSEQLGICQPMINQVKYILK